MALWGLVRGLVRRDVLTICFIIFLADTVTGMLHPTFSLYAHDLGASLTLIGILSGTLGLTQFFLSVPMGLVSDRTSPKFVVTLGMLAFAAAMTCLALAPNPYWLFPGRALAGLASVATFFIGIAYVGDHVSPGERGLAFGMYTFSMGMGFALGPLAGAAIAAWYGISGSYLVAAGLALVGAGMAAWLLQTGPSSSAPRQNKSNNLNWSEIKVILRDPDLLPGNLTNLLIASCFSGAIVGFFPLYLSQLGLTSVAISSLYSVRGFASAMARPPTGIVIRQMSSLRVMVLALVVLMVVLFLMSQITVIPVLALLLAVEGIGYGTCLTASQAFVAEYSPLEARGTAAGIYSMTGSLGGTLGPVLFGIVADWSGEQMVLRVTGVIFLIGLAAIGYLHLSRHIARQSFTPL
jgi:MFS family permease